VQDIDAPEEREHRLGLHVVVLDALLDGLGMIVRTLHQPAPAYVADAVHLGPVPDEVVVEAALGADAARHHAFGDQAVGRVHMDDAVDVVALEEELRLGEIAREPVQHEAVVPIVPGEAFRYDLGHQVVAHHLALGNDAVDLGRQLGVVGDVPAEDVADGDVDEIVLVADQLGLGAFAASLDAHDDVLVHASRALLENPVGFPARSKSTNPGLFYLITPKRVHFFFLPPGKLTSIKAV
jgi:hypothetical protein